MPTFVSLASASPAQIPMSLSVFIGVIFVIYLIGAFADPRDQGRFSLISAWRSANPPPASSALEERCQMMFPHHASACVEFRRFFLEAPEP